MSKEITIILIAAVCLGLFVSGCENGAQTAAAIGALAGAGIGQLAGGDTEATLIGAAIGAGAGYMIGNENERDKTEAKMDSIRSQQNSVVVWVTNSNDSKVPVRLKRNGPGYVGPRGELYSKLPTQDQLRIVYGF
jgi:uncharacterized membrane protein YhiD involved in acid resistance